MKVKVYTSAEQIRAFCIKHDFFDGGNNTEYSMLLENAQYWGTDISKAHLWSLGQYIAQHTDGGEWFNMDNMVNMLINEACRIEVE